MLPAGTQPYRVAFANDGTVTHLSGPGIDVPPPAGLSSKATEVDAAFAFLAAYKGLHGLDLATDTLAISTQKPRKLGGKYLKLAQYHLGHPVHGGELVVVVDAQKNVRAVMGRTVKDFEAKTAPTLSAAVGESAVKVATQQVPHPGATQLEYYVPLGADFGAQGSASSTAVLTWAVVATDKNGDAWRYRIDSHSGKLLHTEHLADHWQRRLFSPTFMWDDLRLQASSDIQDWFCACCTGQEHTYGACNFCQSCLTSPDSVNCKIYNCFNCFIFMTMQRPRRFLAQRLQSNGGRRKTCYPE